MRQLVFILLFIGIAATSRAQSNKQSAPEISVSATAKVSANPDIAEFRIGIVTRNEQATSAFRMYLDRYRGLHKSLAGLVDSTQLKTNNLSISPYFNYKRPDRTSPEYYQVSASMSLSIPISRLNNVIGAVASVEGVTIDGIQFRVKDEARLELEALRLADRQARRKAEAIASLEGLTDLKVKSMNTSTTPPPIMPMDRLMSVEASAPAVTPGSVSVSASVNVTYTAVQK